MIHSKTSVLFQYFFMIETASLHQPCSALGVDWGRRGYEDHATSVFFRDIAKDKG